MIQETVVQWDINNTDLEFTKYFPNIINIKYSEQKVISTFTKWNLFDGIL